MTVVHLMVPGLARRHLPILSALAALRERRPDTVASLVCSFPATVAGVEASLLAGAPGVVTGDLPRTPRAAGPVALGGVDGVAAVAPDLDLLGGASVAHLRWEGLLGALREEGEGGDREIEALTALDHRLRIALEHHDRVLLSGGPALQPVRRRVQLPPGGPDPRGRWTAGAIAVIPGGGTEAQGAWLEDCLRIDGVERRLEGRALELWGAPASLGTALLAEADASFDAGRVAEGHREVLDPGRTPVLLAWGRSGSRAWPAAVHDWRIGPTLLAAAGLEAARRHDAPLPW